MSVAERLIQIIQSSSPVTRVNDLLKNDSPVHIKGAVGALKSLLLVNFHKRFSTQVVYIGHNFTEVETVREEVELLLGANAVSYFPGRNRTKFSHNLSDHVYWVERHSAIESLAEGKNQIVVVQCDNLICDFPSPKGLLNQKISIKTSDGFEFEEFKQRLIDFGYVRELRVERAGEMSVRGGIVDVFPYSSNYPIRIEFWENTVESIRKFDSISQRSMEKIEQLTLYPQEFNTSNPKYNGQTSLLDHLSSDAIIIFDEPELIRKQIKYTVLEVGSVWKNIIDKVETFRRVYFISIGEDYSNLINLSARSQISLNGNLKQFKKSLKALNLESLKDSKKLPHSFFLCDNRSHVTRIEEIFSEAKIFFPNLSIGTLGLHNGFYFPGGSIAVFTEHQFYGRPKRLRLPRKSHQGLSPKQLKYLNIGDYVVHVDYGIGVFRGLKKIKVRGHERECLHLEYKDKDNLYVRIEKMDRVHKYASKDGIRPTLNKLGGTEWQRLKTRTKKKIKDIAQELIEIYAKRKAQTGLSFSEDTLWQRELEASFPYEDTPDQLKATLDVKKDMESHKPMDRLVCGDVGFGKTEIAVRAAFKAVLSGKQVAMLVPTTILACQHLNTFQERLQKFPIHVEMLSRFRTRAEQKKIIEKLKNGQIDIVIGTHRILSKDVFIKELGLLIIDEEQRFGVRHKERLKKLRANIDVLTLTATPIPRTLYMSMMGARDISNINTPPRNRLPIVTEISSFNKDYVRDVILREIDRGGQVFFVHNRVRSIERIAGMLSRLVPEANVAIAHGQMDEQELEQVMIEFMQNKFQVLISTMIIESGLDMPNVNTIIINRADKMGLAQLYQLRGRVGRSHHRAYAYLLIPPIENLTDEAAMRLRAFEEFSDIGSGSQLAMRDLEIRGAGNLLGAEQSGFIDTLGFDLYNKILDEAVKEIKNEKNLEEEVTQEIETFVEMDLDAFIPDDYIVCSSDRVDIYRRLTECTRLDQLEDMRLELEDRFGKIPITVDNLLKYLTIRLIGRVLNFRRIQITKQEMVAEFAPTVLELNREQFKNWLGSMVVNATAQFELIHNNGPGIRLPINSNINEKLLYISQFLLSLTKTQKKEVA